MASSVNGADCGATEAQRKGRNEREKLHQKRELRQGMVRPHTGGMVEKRVRPQEIRAGQRHHSSSMRDKRKAAATVDSGKQRQKSTERSDKREESRDQTKGRQRSPNEAF